MSVTECRPGKGVTVYGRAGVILSVTQGVVRVGFLDDPEERPIELAAELLTPRSRG